MTKVIVIDQKHNPSVHPGYVVSDMHNSLDGPTFQTESEAVDWATAKLERFPDSTPYQVMPLKVYRVELVDTVRLEIKDPKTFIEEFCSDPKVDDVMRRLADS